MLIKPAGLGVEGSVNMLVSSSFMRGSKPPLLKLINVEI